MRTATMWKAALAAAVILAPTGAQGQELADYDYANLSFRGVLFEGGYIFANNIENTEIFGLRFDLGFLGPGFRIVPGVSYWTSRMAEDEVLNFEARLGALSTAQGGTVPPGGFDLGVIDRDDLVFSLDGHYMWAVPLNLFLWTGVGASAHILNGSGASVDGTFVEDLLDSVAAGFNVHGGLELPLTQRFRAYSGSKLEILGDLRYVELRFGLSYIWGGLVSGEGG